MRKENIKLSDLCRHTRARVANIVTDDPQILHIFDQMGLHEEIELEIMHEGPVCRDPMAISVSGSIFAIRRREAAFVEVEEIK